MGTSIKLFCIHLSSEYNYFSSICGCQHALFVYVNVFTVKPPTLYMTYRAVVVFDVNKRRSFESALSTIVEHKKSSSIDHVGSKMPIMLVGTKSDIASYEMQSRITVVGQHRARDKERESSIGIDSFISEEEQRTRAERYNITLNVCKTKII